jgi:hypothetical protein
MTYSIPQCSIDSYPLKSEDKNLKRIQGYYSIEQASDILRISESEILDAIDKGSMIAIIRTAES